ncbi:MAG: ABC transporter transmembrane domain-containing protein, partial [Alkaliphilus sp.]
LNFNSEITLILLPLIPLYMMLYFVFRKPLYEKNYHFKEEQNMFFSKMNQYLRNINLIKINATFQEAHENIETGFKSMFKAALKQQKFSLFFSSSKSLITVISRGVIFFYGGREIIRGNLTIGQFTIISSYFAMMMSSISYYLSFGGEYQNALVSHDRLKEILNEPKEINGDHRIFQINKIELKDVSL